MQFKKSKGAIVATIGPASDSKEILHEMIEAGLDVVRINMSHGTHNEAKARFNLVRSVDDTIPILFDLSGPKIRIGIMERSVELITGNEFTLTKKEVSGDDKQVSVTYKEMIDLAKVGNQLFLNDGLIELKVKETTKDKIVTDIISGGPLSSRKGVNAPEIPITLFSPTEKDIKDLDFTLGLEPDFYSVSFVRRVSDLDKVREIITTQTNDEIPLISKIEHRDAITKMDEIIKSSDGIMVARGDLGVELPPEDVPFIQEQLVVKCNQAGKPCIVATQMLESMVLSPRPTRAETSDVANAINQGADAVMLSAESATGHYPVEAIAMMNRIIKSTEGRVKQRSLERFDGVRRVEESIARSAVSLASGLGADNLFAFTRTGSTCAIVSKFKPNQPIIAVTPSIKTARRVRIHYGVIPLLLRRDFTDTDEMMHAGIHKAYTEKLIKRDSTSVLVAGSLLGLPTSTNLIQFLNTKDIVSSIEATERFARSYSLIPDKDAN